MSKYDPESMKVTLNEYELHDYLVDTDHIPVDGEELTPICDYIELEIADPEKLPNPEDAEMIKRVLEHEVNLLLRHMKHCDWLIHELLGHSC